jgi:hypothetical protein
MAFDKEIPPADPAKGGEATESIRFSLDGMSYEVELSEEEAGGLRRALDRYIRCARRLEYPDRCPLDWQDKAGWTESRLIREWARDAGVTICERGAIPKAVVSAYHREVSAEHVGYPAETHSR